MAATKGVIEYRFVWTLLLILEAWCFFYKLTW